MALRVALCRLVFALSLISFASMATSAECGYEVEVKTGNTFKAGTDSEISLTLVSCTGKSFNISNLRNWKSELPGEPSEYFNQGKLARFSGRDRCLDVCAMQITSKDAMKPAPKSSGWYVEYVQVKSADDGSEPMMFPVNRWLSNDVPPQEACAVVNLCNCRVNLNTGCYPPVKSQDIAED